MELEPTRLVIAGLGLCCIVEGFFLMSFWGEIKELRDRTRAQADTIRRLTGRKIRSWHVKRLKS